MSYKTILVHVNESRHLDARLRLAAEIAAAENAHLIGLALTGVSRVLFQTVSANPADPNIAPYLELVRQQAEDLLDKFEDAAQRIGVVSYEKRITDDEPAGGLSLHGRYCDLVVLGQPDPSEPVPSIIPDFLEYVIMNCGGPVLIAPYAGRTDSIGNRVLVAWNASVEAARSVHYAIPLLQRANSVEVAIFNPASLPDVVFGEQQGSGIQRYLARHDIKADVRQETTGTDVGQALLSLAAGLGSDLLVMGCYGHSRFREILLGGATRTVLRSTTMPVLMSH